MNGQTIELQDTQGNPFKAYVSLPKGGRGPGVVIGLDVHGLRPMFHDIADMYADRGYLAIVPDYFWDAHIGEDKTYLHSFKMTTGEEVTKSAMAHVKKMTECNGKVLVTGYCMGGNTAFLAVARLGADAAVAYYGTLLQDYLDEFKNVRQPLILHVAWEDRTYSAADRDRILAEANKNPAITTYIYDEPHGFATSRKKEGGCHEIANARTFELFDRFK